MPLLAGRWHHCWWRGLTCCKDICENCVGARLHELRGKRELVRAAHFIQWAAQRNGGAVLHIKRGSNKCLLSWGTTATWWIWIELDKSPSPAFFHLGPNTFSTLLTQQCLKLCSLQRRSSFNSVKYSWFEQHWQLDMLQWNNVLNF